MTNDASRETVANRTRRLADGGFLVVHPLDDVAEQKCETEGLGYTPMTPMIRVSLIALRSYIVIMALMVLYRCLELAKFIG
jgi:hypothetical protein